MANLNFAQYSKMAFTANLGLGSTKICYYLEFTARGETTIAQCVYGPKTSCYRTMYSPEPYESH